MIIEFKNISRKCLFFIFAFTIPLLSFSQTVGLFFDADVPQIKFAANDIKDALQSKGFTIEVLPLASLNASYANKKVVISLVSDVSTSLLLTNQGGAALPVLGEQAYTLRTTATPQTTYWAIGGDEVGAMYGGIELSEFISANGFSGTYNNDEKPFMLNRGMKLNMPLDNRLPTYSGNWNANSATKAIPHVWDMTYWKKLIDYQARNRYNVLSVWVHHPFPALVKLADYPNASLPKIEGFDGFSLDMNHNQRVAFWREVMRYAKDHGMKFYFFNWNVELDYASTKYPALNEEDVSLATNVTTKDYMYKSMYALLETYPELTGFGISAGDAMQHQGGFNNDNNLKTQWTWETMGKAVKDFLVANPSRQFHLIHRGLGSGPDIWNTKYATLMTQPNATNTYSVKYAQAHMYSTTTPTWYNYAITGVKDVGKKTWLTVRNDDYFYLNWGDPQFARDFMYGIPYKDNVVTGMYIGSDCNSPSRAYFCKNPDMNGQLEVERRWYMEKVWGRISYNPNTSDDVFKNLLATRYPSVSSNDLFQAWSKVSRTLPKVTELIMGEWSLDIHWWPEGCNSSTNSATGFRTIYDFANLSTHPNAVITSVANGSPLCDIPTSATGSCNGKKSSYTVADEMQTDAQDALNLVASMNSEGNSDLHMAITNIKQMAYLGMYYAHKVRGATYLRANQKPKAKDEMAMAYCWWMAYTRTMENEYYGDKFRSQGIDANWKTYDAAVLKDYTDMGGVGVPTCNLLNHKINLSSNNNDFGTVTVAGTFQSSNTVTVNAVAKPGYEFVNWTQYGNQVSADATYNFVIYCDVNLVANFRSLETCDVPYSNIGLTVNSTTVSRTIASIDISCAKAGVKLLLDVEGIKVDAMDYCKIYYKVDAAAQVTLINQAGLIAFQTLTASGLKGNKLDIIVDIKNSFKDEFYYVKNIKVIEDNLKISLNSNGCAGSIVSGGGVFNVGDPVTVSATPALWCTFVNWTENGVEQSTNQTYTFAASKSRTLQANFKQNISTYQIALSVVGAPANTVSGGGPINEGDNVTVSAVVPSGCNFVNWTEDGIEVSKNLTYKFVATRNRNLVANFSCIDGINDIENKARIYPNPVSKTLHIDFTDNLVEKEISIINSVGQMVYKVKTKDSKYVIDVSFFQLKGMVVLKIISGNKVQHHSILIK